MKIAAEPPSAVVSVGRDGAMRVAGTRVTLESVVAAFVEGATAEEIQMRYPALRLADTYAAIAWYLSNQKLADRYISERAKLSSVARKEAAFRLDHATFRARLVARTASHRRARVHA